VSFETFVGVDLAWGERNRTGLAAIGADGSLLDVVDRHTNNDIADWLTDHAPGSALVAIDAPLIVTNPTGSRRCEQQLSVEFGRYDAGTHPSNTARPWFTDGTRGFRLAHRAGLDVDPGSTSERRAIEVYPHPATIVLFDLDRTIKYKHKRGRTLDQLRSASLRLITLIESLETADPPLHLRNSSSWHHIRDAVAAATQKSHLRTVEDRIDAVICAYIALFTARCPDRTTVFGDGRSGYIVTPTLPPDHRRPARRSPSSPALTERPRPQHQA
jgi:predicted RNase H-like nuclease